MSESWLPLFDDAASAEHPDAAGRLDRGQAMAITTTRCLEDQLQRRLDLAR